jgi:hypothetical protein
MSMTLTALAMKFLSIWVVLLFIGLVTGPTPGQGAFIAAAVAIVSYLADRLVPFRVQGITRWAMDGGLAGFSIYLAQFLWPGQFIPFYWALLSGFLIGAFEIPLHFFLAARFGLRRRNDERDGIR